MTTRKRGRFSPHFTICILSALLATACVEEDAEITSPALDLEGHDVQEGSDIATLRGAPDVRRHISGVYQERQFFDMKSSVYEVPPVEQIDPPEGGFEGLVTYGEPEEGNYMVTDVSFADESGARVEGEGNWVGSFKLDKFDRYSLALLERLEDGHGNSSYGRRYEIQGGFILYRTDRMLFSDNRGVHVFSMFYDFMWVDGDDTGGYLDLERPSDDRAPVEAGQPLSIRLVREKPPVVPAD